MSGLKKLWWSFVAASGANGPPNGAMRLRPLIILVPYSTHMLLCHLGLDRYIHKIFSPATASIVSQIILPA